MQQWNRDKLKLASIRNAFANKTEVRKFTIIAGTVEWLSLVISQLNVTCSTGIPM